MRGFEMRLVLEFCDCGTLRDALDNVGWGRHVPVLNSAIAP